VDELIAGGKARSGNASQGKREGGEKKSKNLHMGEHRRRLGVGRRPGPGAWGGGGKKGRPGEGGEVGGEQILVVCGGRGHEMKKNKNRLEIVKKGNPSERNNRGFQH